MVHRGESGQVVVWTEDVVKDRVRRLGLKTPCGVVLEPNADLSPVGLTFPVAVKVCSPSILHKTEVGGVILGLRDHTELVTAVQTLRRRFPGNELLIENMEEKGVEVIVGVVNDASFGLAIMFGLGGTLAELYKDVTFRLVPISRVDAQSMLEDLYGRDLLEGFRGHKVDRGALVELLLSISNLAEELGDSLLQMDLNPVFARPYDAVVVDGKVLLKDQ